MDATQFATGVGDVPRTLTDLAMSQFSYDLRHKPDWIRDHVNPENRDRWTKEASSRAWKVRIPGGSVNIKLTALQIQYVLDELEGYRQLHDSKLNCQVSCFERIWETISQSDTTSLLQLNEGISALRLQNYGASAPGRKRWLLDPYLYPLVYNQTLVSVYPEWTTTLPAPRLHFNTSDSYAISSRLAHLPSLVHVSQLSPAPPTAIFCSYINNLHPTHHKSLYASLSTILGSLIPLFEHTLTDLHRNNPLTPRISGACMYTVWDEPDPPEHSDDEEGWQVYESEMTRYRGGLETRRQTVSLVDREIKIVVSIYEVQLDPSNPSYPGSQWHVEGMRNERITACAVYVASADNVNSAGLQFRMAITYPGGFMLGDSGATLRTWGLRDVDPCHQYIGSVPLSEPGFGVVFPNIYQHRLAPLQLTDPTKPGRLTCVLYWLIDPDLSGNSNPNTDMGRHQTIVSTANVPPQQKEWISDALNGAIDQNIPCEVVERIVDATEGLMNQEAAEKMRKAMRTEREMFWKLNNMNYFCVPFDVWGQI
ncbi:hypothetical protein ONZ45_g453 [Pleurotus djamor]|nr:hypothetical protein ONZ45_g453 [Pleurotus djamor]